MLPCGNSDWDGASPAGRMQAAGLHKLLTDGSSALCEAFHKADLRLFMDTAGMAGKSNTSR